MPLTQGQLLLNLREGNTNCIFELLSVTIKASELVRYVPAHQTSIKLQKQNSATLISETSSSNILAIVEQAPNDPLGHNETLEITLLPPKAENRLPSWESFYDIPETQNQTPKIFVSEIVNEGKVEGAEKHGIFIFLECEYLRQGTFCGDQNLLDLRFSLIFDTPLITAPQEAENYFHDITKTIIPGSNNIYKNGLRFYVLLPLDTYGNPPRGMSLLARYQESYRKIIINLAQILGSNP